jgi:hypothetical protein
MQRVSRPGKNGGRERVASLALPSKRQPKEWHAVIPFNPIDSQWLASERPSTIRWQNGGHANVSCASHSHETRVGLVIGKALQPYGYAGPSSTFLLSCILERLTATIAFINL